MLIIDDEPEIGSLFARVADECGYQTVMTTSMTEFEERVRDWHPTHIVIDLHMPIVDGVEVMRFLAQERSKAQLIIASGADPKVVESARQLGLERGLAVVGTIRKPARASELAEVFLEFRKGTDWIGAADLTAAIRDGQFTLEYQPMVRRPDRAGSGIWSDVVAMEALLRWDVPSRGRISPAEFIPIAESLDLMDAITDMVCQSALTQLAEWNRKGIEVPIAINVSAENLHRADLVERTFAKANDVGIDPSSVVFELTETAAMGDVVLAMDILTRLRLKGFRLAMDDFGTGYSSLVQLQRLPFSELKIDREFVAECARSPQSRMIVNAMVNLAHNLELTVVGEGVEDRRTLDVLAEVGCDIAQGFLIARPMAADAVEKWLRTRSVWPSEEENEGASGSETEKPASSD